MGVPAMWEADAEAAWRTKYACRYVESDTSLTFDVESGGVAKMLAEQTETELRIKPRASQA